MRDVTVDVDFDGEEFYTAVAHTVCVNGGPAEFVTSKPCSSRHEKKAMAYALRELSDKLGGA